MDFHERIRLMRVPALVGCCGVVFGASVAVGQTNSQLLLKPWAEKEFVEHETSALFQSESDIEDKDYDVQIWQFDSFGRVRIMPGEVASPRIGYDVLYMNVDSGDPALPDQLWDVSVAAGLLLGDFDGWILGATVGVGYAGDTPFGDGEPWYGLGTVGVAKDLGNDQFVGVLLDYDGNRSFMPDTPLPGAFYGFRVDPTIRAVLGLPVSSLTWEPSESFTAEVSFYLPDQFDARVTYRPFKGFSIYGSFENRFEGFQVDKITGNNRLLFEQRLLEAGVQWEPMQRVGLGAAIGYAFDQEFRSGFDIRDSDEVAELSDEVYFRLTVRASY
jgi:hypothetical protein